MPIVNRPQDLVLDDLYIDLSLLRRHLYVKCEGFNFAGSAKLKTAVAMVEGAERRGQLTDGSVVVESTSGNLGVALALVCAERGYPFISVLDPLCNTSTRRIIEALGAHVMVVDRKDARGGYLGTRIETVRDLCRSNPAYVWLDQYTNGENWRAHYERTAAAVDARFPTLDYLFVGTGTGGTLMGCARYFKERDRPTRIVAVDVVGSVTFGGPAGPRRLPGLGTSRHSRMVDVSYVDEVVLVDEAETIAMCRRLARHGYLLGASTGSVLSGALTTLAGASEDAVAVAIAPDLGERYVHTVYDDGWVEEHFEGAPAAHDFSSPIAL
ncbi:2,3-diaminopropionate biosynthesis protein SbnA [Streptomyces sp. NPDC005209]|uniref:2,3-diaminopropionate biosynthesis protein SbnA n=1 Tax=Streptomyces sp. NPDC005209 TaxID=3156715 RepID=UPI0033BF007F